MQSFLRSFRGFSVNSTHYRQARQLSDESRHQYKLFTESDRTNLCINLEIPEAQIALKVSEFRTWRKSLDPFLKVGFVPTMGALHEGHLALMDKCRKECDIVVSSIFVNPAQFAPHEDYSRYPWFPESDIQKMVTLGADKVFVPGQMEMYPNSELGQTFTNVTTTFITPKNIDFISEGSARPGFFQGVCTVVGKLFNIVQPHVAYFGQKDGLQVMAVRRLVKDLNFDVKIIPCDTVREVDGLAKSSRNIYLNKEQRSLAPNLFKSLTAVKECYNKGERSYENLIQIGRRNLNNDKYKIEYLSICDALTGDEFKDKLPDSNIMVSSAIHFGNCRLIDNVLLGKQT